MIYCLLECTASYVGFGLWARLFLPFGNKENFLCFFLLIIFGCSVVTSVTFSSNIIVTLKKKMQQTKSKLNNIFFIQKSKIQKKIKKSKKNPIKVNKNP